MFRGVTLAIIALAPGLAQAACQNIQAPATVRGRAPAETPFACYNLAGEPGKTAMVQIAQPNPSVAFNISGVVGNRSEYSFKMQAKTYRIEVYDMGRGGSSPFSMTVTAR